MRRSPLYCTASSPFFDRIRCCLSRRYIAAYAFVSVCTQRQHQQNRTPRQTTSNTPVTIPMPTRMSILLAEFATGVVKGALVLVVTRAVLFVTAGRTLLVTRGVLVAGGVVAITGAGVLLATRGVLVAGGVVAIVGAGVLLVTRGVLVAGGVVAVVGAGVLLVTSGVLVAGVVVAVVGAGRGAYTQVSPSLLVFPGGHAEHGAVPALFLYVPAVHAKQTRDVTSIPARGVIPALIQTSWHAQHFPHAPVSKMHNCSLST